MAVTIPRVMEATDHSGGDRAMSGSYPMSGSKKGADLPQGRGGDAGQHVAEAIADLSGQHPVDMARIVRQLDVRDGRFVEFWEAETVTSSPP